MKADSADKRYVNVVGGPVGGPDIATVCEELTLAGFGEWIEIVPGPLMRATYGKLVYAHMPLDARSTYHYLGASQVMEQAWQKSLRGPPDPEPDLQGFEEPLWGHHSFRRFADTVARETMGISGATTQDIDILFGWQERMYNSTMQIHYESVFTRDRRTRVTRYA